MSASIGNHHSLFMLKNVQYLIMIKYKSTLKFIMKPTIGVLTVKINESVRNERMPARPSHFSPLVFYLNNFQIISCSRENSSINDRYQV